MNADYRVVLYKNEADADANTTVNAEWNVDGMPYEVGDASTASTAVTVLDTTLQALNDYDRSPLFVNVTDFTAGAPPHVITIASDRNPGATLTRYWKMSADGTVAAAVVSARSSTSVTINESLLSTDTIFMGDDTNRNIHDGDPLDIRTRIGVYSTTEADAITDLKLVKTANLSDVANAATARSNLDVYSTQVSNPSGMVQYFAMSTAPTGWMKANGAAVSRTTYATLFTAIGTVFGVGDGSTTFNLPDLRGEFIRGWDDGKGTDTGRVFGSSQADEFKSHTHTIYDGDSATDGAYFDAASGSIQRTNTTNATGGTETRPRNIALLACIKY